MKNRGSVKATRILTVQLVKSFEKDLLLHTQAFAFGAAKISGI